MHKEKNTPLPPTRLLRIALGIVFFHFGILKFFPDLSPAEMLASQTIMRISWNGLDARTAMLWLAVLECTIGLGFLLNFGLRFVSVLFLLHMTGTFMPLLVLPELAFTISPLGLTLEGQYVLKNLVFMAAGWTVLLPHCLQKRDCLNQQSQDVAATPNLSITFRPKQIFRIAMNRTFIGRVVIAICVIAMIFGMRETYERYRGTDNSRVPAHNSVFNQPSFYSRANLVSLFSQPSAPAKNTSPDTRTPHAENKILRLDQSKTESLRGSIDELMLYPSITKGMRTPFDLWRYYGRGSSSFGSPVLPMRFEQWHSFHRKQKPKLMRDVRKYMNGRFDFSGESITGQYMSGGKPVMKGPIARLPKGVNSYEELASLSTAEIRKRDLFPFKPLAHPLQSVAHMLFPPNWLKAHPEHQRIDVDLDIPEEYLPEFPPPMFLTTHKELGDVTNGREVTLDNFFEIFDGLLTPEQMEGLKELLRPSPTTWFNHTDHRITEAPSKGVACFDCHVNGHTSGAIELGPDSRPNMARLRVDTPTMRGNYNLMQLSSKRSIRSMDHFSEVEEYFDGDPGMQQAIGPRAVKREVTNRMGDFNSILDYPPAPKLDPLMRLIPELASKEELRGEALFHGKAQCAKCHYGPAFVDDYMHDLKVERFYTGRPEGPIKTFPLRGIKDSPPYLHDGRLPTLHDTVEFFNLVLSLGLNKQEKDDLVAYMLCL